MGNLFITDQSGPYIYKSLAETNYINTFALDRGLSGSAGVALDASGNVFVADPGNNAVKKILATGDYVTVNTLPGDFSAPTGVAVDRSGNVYVAEPGAATIKKILSGDAVMLPTTAVGSTSVALSVAFTFDTGGQIGAPVVLTLGATGLDFADAGTGTCTTNGASHTYNAGDTCTVDVTFAPKYPGQRMGAVQLTTTDGTVIATNLIYGTGTGPMLTFPGNTTVNTLANTLGTFDMPKGVAVDGSGNVYVADTGHKR
jgi:streptogramin lyase